jgi:hypothetical protein
MPFRVSAAPRQDDPVAADEKVPVGDAVQGGSEGVRAGAGRVGVRPGEVAGVEGPERLNRWVERASGQGGEALRFRQHLNELSRRCLQHAAAV